MRLPAKIILYFLIAANLAFSVLLFRHKSAVPFFEPEKCVKMDVKNVNGIEILRGENADKIYLHRLLNGTWMCNFEDRELPANEHALEELFALCNSLKFSECENHGSGTPSSDRAVISIILIGDGGNTAKLTLDGSRIHLTLGGVTHISDGDSAIVDRLVKICGNLYRKNLIDSADAILGIKFSAGPRSLSFAKSMDHFRMKIPLERAVDDKFIGSILRSVAALNCSEILADGNLKEPLFTLAFESGRTSDTIEFYLKNSCFYAKKHGITYAFDRETSDSIGALHEKFVNFRPFFGIVCDSIGVFDPIGNRQVVLQKLENSEGWHMSFNRGGNVAFTDVSGEKIYSIENEISKLGQPIKCAVESHGSIGKLHLKSNIGELNFNIFEHLGKYVIFNSESSLFFSLRKEFIETLFSLFEPATGL